MKYRDTASVRRQTASLIQRLVALIGTLEPLPDGCVPYLKLSYYEERTISLGISFAFEKRRLRDECE